MSIPIQLNLKRDAEDFEFCKIEGYDECECSTTLILSVVEARRVRDFLVEICRKEEIERLREGEL